jgi:hypothetical protein
MAAMPAVAALALLLLAFPHQASGNEVDPNYAAQAIVYHINQENYS